MLIKNIVIYVIVMIWIVFFVISILDFVFICIDLIYGYCVLFLSVEGNSLKEIYVVVVISFYILLLFFVIMFCYF